METQKTDQSNIYAILAIQLLTLLFQFINGLLSQIHKNKLEQIQAINEKQNSHLEEQSKKIGDLHKSSQNGSNI